MLPEGIYFHDAQTMPEIADASVTLVVTSPPYNVNKEYETEATDDSWTQMMRNVLAECNRVLIDGGRICINVAAIGRHPYKPLYYYIIQMAFELGWTMRGTILWLKGGTGPKSSWGSFGLATDPILRDSHEFILVFQKGGFKIPKGESGISPEEFMEFTRAEWKFTPENTDVNHPAPFPDELPRRCILLYSNEGDIVLDPFGGSGTTFKVALLLKRKAVMYEKYKKYASVIEQRLQSPLRIQSEAWERYKMIKELYPDLYSKSKRELLKIAKDRFGQELNEMTCRIDLIHYIADESEKKKQSSLKDFFWHPKSQ